MKKSLVLAMAMALGVTASAYAANPFSDVPAGHWAYDSISKLAAAGVIEGYGDDTFRGDRLMTRYEMAQIVAKAMAKGANVNKLAAEFADELDALGVRVAALEKKADNVKITGQIRWRWRLGTADSTNPAWLGGRRRNHDLRTRLWFNGQINENWKYIGMIENTQNFMNDQGDETNNNFTYQRAYVEGRLGGVKVTAGRYHEELVGGDSDVYSHRIDGVKLKYGFGKANLMGYYGKLTAAPQNARPRGYGIHADVDLAKKVNLFVGFDSIGKGTNANIAGDQNRHIFDVGLKAGFGDFGLTAIYLRGNSDVNANANTDKKGGWTLEAKYKGAKAAKPGSWGIIAKYYDQGNLTYWAHGAFTGKGGFQPNNVSGFKGFRIGGEYTVAKNMIGRINYFDLKAKDAGNAQKVKTIYTEMIMTF